MRNLAQLILSVSGLLLGLQIAAASEPFRVGPIAAAMGGAGIAAVDGSESSFLNPATLAHVQAYYVGLGHQQLSHATQGSHRDFSLMLSDGGPDHLAAGALSYVRREALRAGAGAISSNQDDIQFSLAGFLPPFGSQGRMMLGIGVTGRRLIHRDAQGTLTQDTGSLGLILPFNENWGLGFVARDLAASADNVPAEARLRPVVGLGIQGQLHELLRVRADVLKAQKWNPKQEVDFRLGLESFFRKEFAFRLGTARLESLDQNWVTVGLGFIGPRLSFGYAYEQDTRSGASSRHTFDLWLPL